MSCVQCGQAASNFDLLLFWSADTVCQHGGFIITVCAAHACSVCILLILERMLALLRCCLDERFAEESTAAVGK